MENCTVKRLAMIFKDQLVFLKMMSLLRLECVVPSLVITFELAYKSYHRQFECQISVKVKVHLAG